MIVLSSFILFDMFKTTCKMQVTGVDFIEKIWTTLGGSDLPF